MKSLFFAILLSGVSAFASNVQFQIISGKIARAHGGPRGIGTISIDYKQKLATLTVDPNYCPPNQVCTLEYRPMFITTLPITSVTTTDENCNIKTVVAQADERPVDGILEKLTIEDFSGNTCPTFTEIIGKAEYQTAGYNRLQGHEFEENSKFDTKLIRPAALKSVLLEKVTIVGFAPPEYLGHFSFQVLNDGTVQYVNNHDEVKIAGKISTRKLATIQKLVDALKDVKLIDPTGVGCMDVPSSLIVAHQNQNDITLLKEESCRETTTSNEEAKLLISAIKKLEAQYPNQQ
jgi:hypothetical protein